MKFSEKAVVAAMKLGMKITGVSQNENQPAIGEYKENKGFSKLLREVAADGAILLKNDGCLPYKKKETVSVFGRCQYDWFFTGYGSGGDVKLPYSVNLTDGIKNCKNLLINEELADIYNNWCIENPVDHGVWAHWPRSLPEMPLTYELVEKAAEKTDAAIYVIGRSSGEDRENVLEEGSYYLTADEKNIIKTLSEKFKSLTVLLNIGCIIDMSWINEFKEYLNAVMIVWQGGMESGNAVADLLCGAVSPSGKLCDSVALSYKDYPSASSFGNKDYNEYCEDIFVGYRYFETFSPELVQFPFGFGLSYTDFSLSGRKVKKTDDAIIVSVNVKNTGAFPGKQVLQLYLEKPNTFLGNPSRELVAFSKTSLLSPGESESLELRAPKYFFTSYDDCGETGYPFSYLLQEGTYSIYLGTDVRNAKKIWSYEQEKTELYKKLKQVCAPHKPFMRTTRNSRGNKESKQVLTAQYDLKKIIHENLPETIEFTGYKGYSLKDVKDKKVSIEDFTAQLTSYELEAICRGDIDMDSPLGVKGNAGVLGGTIKSLRDKGIPALTTTDGPSGIRLLYYASLIPIGSLLASTYDPKLVERIYSYIGKEMKALGSDILLAPGMNIHRNPLCGRNFEYFSEDPLLSGYMAAATISGIQSSGLSACPKHFACNNQEYNRTHNDSRVSERALREIYLRGFEIAVKKANPKCIMTSYNKINGVWGHYNYELCQRILRDEWNYDGLVMTDWWMRSSKSPEFPKLRDNAYRVRSSVDVLMPGAKRLSGKSDNTLLETLDKNDGITLGELQRSAIRVIRTCMKIQ